ncbi:MAG: alpha/beta hydrolase [Firmicutes bacterium]|nr:alpha/beta hydrolase [Bacillota bacterium]
MAHWYLIHGAASSRLTWTRQMKVLPSATRAELPPLWDIAPDHLIEAWADWCLQQLHQPAVIMGHSLGGAIAQRMALKSPTLVAGLVLVGTGPHLPVNPSLIQSLTDAPQEALERITRWSLSKEAEPELVARSLVQAQQIDGRRAYREFLSCTYFDVRDELARIECPRAIIAGEEDRMTPKSLTDEFVEAWPEALHYTVPAAGHMMMLEQPDAFNAILADVMDHFNW